MERDASRDQSGDQAAWRDLVARLELPSAVDPANAPWPDRENLHATADTPSDASAPDAGTGKATPGNRSRVIKPASFTRFSDPAENPPAAGATKFPLAWNAHPSGGQVPEPSVADGYLDDATHPDLGCVDRDGHDDADTDERYVPPHVPPLPKLDPVARGAWTALFGGPGYLFIATTLDWQVPGWAELAAIIAFVAGFVVLVSRLGDGPSRRDGPDQGAVV